MAARPVDLSRGTPPGVEPEQRDDGDRHDDDHDDPTALEDDGNDGKHGDDGQQAARDRR
jgi:hypothetical protein